MSYQNLTDKTPDAQFMTQGRHFKEATIIADESAIGLELTYAEPAIAVAPAKPPVEGYFISPVLLERWQERRAEAQIAINEAIPLERLDSDGLDALARTLHKLSGTAAMFGEDRLGELASLLEVALRTNTPPSHCEVLALELVRAF